MDALVEAFIRDTETLTDEQLTDFKMGWVGQLPMAILDAAYTQQTRYLTKNGKGLLPRLRRFKETFPGAESDLRVFLEVPESEIASIVGRGVTAGRSKASAVREAAQNLVGLEPPVHTAEDYNHEDASHVKAYRSVHGLGKVTHNYLGMLLGYPDTKPDTWIIRAVQRVADEAGLQVAVNVEIARFVVTSSHELARRGATVTHFDHAIWLAERLRAEQNPGLNKVH